MRGGGGGVHMSKSNFDKFLAVSGNLKMFDFHDLPHILGVPRGVKF